MAFSLTLLLGAAAMAQTRTITGTVKDQNGQPLKGVNVMVKGTKTGSTTDETGNYSIAVDKNATLILSFTGYSSKEIKVGTSQSSISTQLTLADKSLDDVVVVGYGTQKKINMTGAIETISAKQLENRPVTSTSALLQGTAPSIVFSTPAGGNTPGSSPTMQIRGQALLGGTTPPLVVIDGIPAGVGDLNLLNPNAIESISVLKDAASSAIYGAKAAFGVLVVTTKMGKKNEKPSFTYNGNFANVENVRTPHTVDSYTFALSRNQAQANSGAADFFSTATLDLIQDNVNNPGKYTLAQLNPNNGLAWSSAAVTANNNDWFDILFKKSFRQQHEISVKGGSDKTSYFFSLAYVNQPGVFNFIQDIDKYKRVNLNAGLVTQVNDWIKLSYRTRYSLANTLAPTGVNNDRNRFYQFAYGGWPTIPVKNTTGQYSALSQILPAMEGGNSNNTGHLLDNILGLDLNLAKGLTVHADGTYRVALNDNQTLRKPVYEIAPNGALNLVQFTDVSSIAKSTALGTYWTLQAYAAYEHSLGKHNFRIQAGSQAEETKAKTLSGSNLNLYVPDMTSIATAYGTAPSLTDAISDGTVVGVFGRFNYNYDNKYLLEVNGRYDGSGRYAADKRWGFFPSASAGWNISSEKFWKSIEPIVNRAKLRASYGTVGNQAQSGYPHISTMQGFAQSPWIFNGARLPYVNMPGILNMDRTWEKFTTADFGLELGFLNNRLSTEFDYFNRLSWDNIGPATPVPSVLGDVAPPVNNAEFVTKGWELQMNWHDHINKNWDYNVGLSLSDAMSHVTKYNVTGDPLLSGWYVGKQFGEIWGYTSNRLLNQNDFPDPTKITAQQPNISQSKINAQWFSGDVKYEDLDGDKLISPGASTVGSHGDLRKIGNSTPRYRFGFNFGTGYSLPKAGRLDVSVFLQGVGKQDLFMGSSYFYWGNMYTGSSIGTGIYQGKQLDYYRDANSNPRLLALLGQNVDAYFPRPYNSSGQGAKNFQTNTRYMVSGAYVRLKNVMATYTLPNQWLTHVKVQTCRFYFSAENIAVLSKLPNYIDPEFVNGGQMYPEQATYSFGVNLGF
ncbi:SusC/RagA family TonB-linked outer membrane protein [Pinibacter soli]|uniref:SusC/RagA family TonB-linked outer membrane protein n=1 Tax=Pinibacter soli TaxID=3044211 RepID=UPI00249CA742|nr:TonB-dependent receptor [Pinibacter soli]